MKSVISCDDKNYKAISYYSYDGKKPPRQNEPRCHWYKILVNVSFSLSFSDHLNKMMFVIAGRYWTLSIRSICCLLGKYISKMFGSVHRFYWTKQNNCASNVKISKGLFANIRHAYKSRWKNWKVALYLDLTSYQIFLLSFSQPGRNDLNGMGFVNFGQIQGRDERIKQRDYYLFPDIKRCKSFVFLSGQRQ